MIQLERRALAVRSVIIESRETPSRGAARVGPGAVGHGRIDRCNTVLVCAVVAGFVPRGFKVDWPNAPTARRRNARDARARTRSQTGATRGEAKRIPSGRCLAGASSRPASPRRTLPQHLRRRGRRRLLQGKNWASPSLHAMASVRRMGPGLGPNPNRSVATASVSAFWDITCASPL